MSFAIAGIAAFLVAVLCTPIVRSISRRLNILDCPDVAPERKIHTRATPLLGGVAVYVSFAAVIGAVLIIKPTLLLGGYLLPKHLIGVLLGGALLMVGGFLDDKKSRSPFRQILWPALAALVVLASGIGIGYISNPLGNALRLDLWSVPLFRFRDLPYGIMFPADAFSFVWLLGAMYTTKFLDGLDGLVSGITTIGMFILFALSLTPSVGQPETALVAIIAAGAFLGFLLFNFHPARIFLGEGGSLFAGFLLGTLAIISGGKIATALLILGIPVLDVVWVVLRRLFVERRSAATGDRKHLHHRLLEMGLSHRQTVLLLYILTAVFGSATLLVHGTSKIIVLAALVALTILLGALSVLVARRRHANIDSRIKG